VTPTPAKRIISTDVLTLAHPARIYPAVCCRGKGKRLTARRRGTTDRYDAEAQDGELKAWYLLLCRMRRRAGNNHEILKKHSMVGTACAWNSFHGSVVFAHREVACVFFSKVGGLALPKSRCPPPHFCSQEEAAM
jgi:hypothetical protein